MSPSILFSTGLLAGASIAAAASAVLFRRARAALGREVAGRVAPVLERRAIALGIRASASPSVDVGQDGDLEVSDEDALARVLRLADAVEEQESSQIAFGDTIRVSKEDVDALLPATGARRARG